MFEGERLEKRFQMSHYTKIKEGSVIIVSRDERLKLGYPKSLRVTADYGEGKKWFKSIFDKGSIKDVTKESEKAPAQWKAIPKRPTGRRGRRVK